jgi:hypothetical protein
MAYKFDNAHEWLDYAIKEEKIGLGELLNFIHDLADNDDIQNYFGEEMDEDGYFDEG